VRVWYGDDIADRYFSFHDAASFVEGTAEQAPMTEWVASMAQAVVTHSSWGIERVLASCPGPVRVVPLPYDVPHRAGHPQMPVSEAHKDFSILTVGHVNPNKRVESVIRAIGQSDALRQETVYRVVGPIGPAVEAKLLALARSLDVRLLVSGEITDEALREAFEESDAACCLRLPEIEAASA